jgi:hypothetical protein
MKEKRFDEARYNFYTAMEKIVSFYKGYMEKKLNKSLFYGGDGLDDYYIDMHVGAHIIMEDIDRLFATPIRTIEDLIDKGHKIMELKDRIEDFEYYYC